MRIINKTLLLTISIALLIIYMYQFLPSVISWGPSAVYSNVSVKTTVNVTQSMPEILNVSCNNGAALTLTAGTTKQIFCQIQIRDFNGGDTIANTNGTFYYSLNNTLDPDDNNVHYTNATCLENATDGHFANWTCAFNIWYYANNGSWIANFTVFDDYADTNPLFIDNDYTNTTIAQLYALNVTNLINFGDLAVGDTTVTPVEANITNFGNMNINVSIYGFGGENETSYAGLAMVCDQRNLTLPNERVSLESATAFAAMTAVTGAATKISGLVVLQQTDDAQQVINATYWRLHVNATSNPFGVCNGTVIFAAEAP